MNITTDLDQVSPDQGKPPEGYEWWYFDGISHDGEFSFVIIFYHENPFSTKKIKELQSRPDEYHVHPAVSVSIYRNSKPVYYSFLEFDENSFSWDPELLLLKVENNIFQYNLVNEQFTYELKLDQTLPSGYSLKGSIIGRGALPDKALLESKSKDRHLWNLILPRLQFKTDLRLVGINGEELIKKEGMGYHDHNIGYEPMKESFEDWYWGRYHFKDFTLIYYLMNKHDERQFEAWLINEENSMVLEHLSEAELDYISSNMFGLRSARKIELKSAQVTVNINLRDKIDNGPFYQRILGNSVIKYKGQVQVAQGVSEFIYPKDIYQKIFWPLVHMRLNYTDQKEHWVQKSPLMYPWTW
jgi:carotenoid 1,2-hydratase